MISFFRLLRNISTFDHVDSGIALPLMPFSLIYAENGRGKTTIAAILRSLGNGDPVPILERSRLGANGAPNIVIAGSGEEIAAFQDGAWSDRFGDIAIFDDVFIAQNVCSGLTIETGHRQNLHELIIGSQGVALSNTLQAYVDRIEQHNRDLLNKSNAIPQAIRAGLSVDQFCALEVHEDIETEIQAAGKNLAATQHQDAITKRSSFVAITLPEFDLESATQILQRNLPDLEAEAAARVQEHFQKLGDNGENWIADGMSKVEAASVGLSQDICPFCAQDLTGSILIAHYQAYFGEAYGALQQAIADQISQLEQAHSAEIQTAFERSIRVATELRQFWTQFTAVPEIQLDTAEIARAWKAAHDAVLGIIRTKQASPLEALEITAEIQAAVESYHALRNQVLSLSDSLLAISPQIGLVKESTTAADVAALQTDLIRLRAIRARFTPEIAALCTDYLQEKTAKAVTEQLRNDARTELNEYRDGIFPDYQNAINDYLRRFNAGFRLSSVSSVNTRGGSSCSYSVLINKVEVPLSPAHDATPSFKNTLSSGDRNVLALAFFFASLESDPNRAEKIVVIDDPITSLDEHRSLTTIQEMRQLANDVEQFIVLSHSKPFLCHLWQGADSDTRSAMKIVRSNPGSTLAEWDVNQDSITEHDRRHAMVREYIEDPNAADERAVAAALRPILEVFARVAYPRWYPPGFLLGPFIGRCEQQKGTADEILSSTDRTELRHLLDYGNRFHHDTNPAWQTVAINDHELLDFARRTLEFTRR